ncbi:hypothetical protein CKO15_09635 [Halorhodospira abdelmalekii]|uniref:porin n=1 Tax=Halorhodospira abdelmalekii TaxID=421629 RepID=UPI001906A8F0|nr:porin [Halorhodospira abdelmalekii]MBK1735539.1 hypothetical protein [Halorhodospira abdelmalekii]
MTHRLLPYAAATLFACAALSAQANPQEERHNFTFYGQIGYELQYLDPEISEADGLDWGAYLSRIGVRGDYTISDELAAVYQVESFLLHGESGDPIGFRNTYGGLRHATFGELRFGRHDTPHKRANLPFFAGANLLFDTAEGSGSGLGRWNTTLTTPETDSGDELFHAIARGRGFIAQRFQRWHGTLHYLSPRIHGVTFEAALRPVQEQGGEESWVDFSTSLTYRHDQWLLNAAYESEGALDDSGAGGSGVYSSWLVGVLFTPNDLLSIGAQVEQLDIDVDRDLHGDLLRILLPIKLDFGQHYVHTFLKYDDFDYQDRTAACEEGCADEWLDIGLQVGYFLDTERNTQVYGVAGSAMDIEGVNYGVGVRHHW